MTISRLKKLWIFAVALALTAAMFAASGISVSANSVSIGSSLFTEIDNINVSAKTDGLKLSSTGRENASIKYSNKLYLGEFSFRFLVTKNNLSTITLKLTTPNKDTSFTGIVKDIETLLTLSKDGEGKLTAKLGDGTAVSIAKNFTDTIQVSKEDNKIIIETTEFALPSAIYPEGYLTIGFGGIDTLKTAEITIKSINGQEFTSTTTDGYVNDGEKAVLRFDETLFSPYAPLGISYELPVYGLDVISTTIKYDISLEYSADGTEYKESDTVTKTSTKFSLDKVGFYRIKTIKIKDNNGNETTECVDRNFTDNPLVIQVSKWSKAKPTIDYTSFKTISREAVGGSLNKFQFAAPSVEINSTPAGVTENPKLIKFELLYKTSTSTSWTKNDGLIFTATSVSEYQFKLLAVDRMGNRSDDTIAEQNIINIRFYDNEAPTIRVTGFPEEGYLDQTITLPSGNTSDDMDSSPVKTIKVYYVKDADGNEVFEKDEEGNIVYEKDEDGNPTDVKKKILVSESYSFKPENLGTYEVIYSAKDASANSVTLSPMYFNVIEAAEAPVTDPFINLDDTWTIVFLSIAAASALGIIILLFIKPKEDEE